MGSGDQTLSVDRQQARADQVVAMARRHAEEIRAAAEQEAERVLGEAERESVRRQEERLRSAEQVRVTAEEEAKRLLLEAEREASRRWEERLEADRRERARLAVNRNQIEDSLDVVAVAVTRLRELIASLAPVESAQPIEVAKVSVPAAPLAATGESSSRRNRIMNFIAVVLGVWAVIMIGTLSVLSRKPADTDTLANVAAPTTQVTAAASSTATKPAEKVATAPVPVAEELGLTIAFVAARDCWISLGVDDATPSDRLLKASERYVVRARDAVSFKAGNAGALSVLINDRPAGSLGAEGQVVARRITRANYRSFLQS